MSKLLNLDEVANELDTSKRTVVKLIEAGRLKALNQGLGSRRVFRVNREWLEEYKAKAIEIDAQPLAATEEPPNLKTSRFMKRLEKAGA